MAVQYLSILLFLSVYFSIYEDREIHFPHFRRHLRSFIFWKLLCRTILGEHMFIRGEKVGLCDTILF
ncbi:hypothetical protein M758_1G006100 [Ceratodon purpureus]|uniref:Uncharacterized protein n=1 Tax=Ceratodon purpureus TaxID=3225 RepID=A0A8T0J290_CERPU|nr:hypothetical protein KC19_1G007200 [Ceratodon purpureus]KAG0628165.1 hypothetical protein M758_1G006100 [Ceratodon purpureus]